MFLSIGQQMVGEIDKLTRRHAQTTASKGELQQLSTLFGKPYLRDLQHLLQGSFTPHRGARLDVTIRIAWIDKIPQADIPTELERTELGDAVLFAFDEFVMPSGKGPGITSARGALLQAKVTQKAVQIVAPTVPISAMQGPTKKEFDLLSAWPTFDLFKASNSGIPLAQNIDLRGTKSGTLPYGWYIAAPQLRSKARRLNTSHWKSWWMAGPPIRNHNCDLTFGELLQAFFSGTQLPGHGNLEVGADFQCKVYPPCPTGLTGWDRICAEIIKIVENSDAPQSIFGPTRTGRMATTGPIRRPPLLRPTLHTGPPASAAYLIGSGPHPACIPLSKSGSGQLIRRLLNWLRGRKRIPILIFYTRLTEGAGV